MDPSVKLGAHDIPVYAQRHAYLTNRLARFFVGLSALQGEADISDIGDLIPLLGDQAYDLLCAVIPTYAKRCPKYEFCGYGSLEAFAAREYDEELDCSPSFPEILTAFQVAAEVNRFDVLKTLAKVVDPKLLKSWINTQLAVAISNASLSSPAPAGGSATSTDSGTTTPTSTESGD